MRSMWHKLTTTVTGGAIIIAFFSVFSKLFGLFRDRLLASYFGAGKILDAYYAAFKLPDLIFNTLVLGALASAFIPVFIRYWYKDKKEAMLVANSVLNMLLIIVGLLSIIALVLAPQLMALIVPGFSGEQFENVVSLTRVMLLSIIFFTISNILSSILNSFKRFVAFSLAPIFYNIGIIFGIVALYGTMGPIGLAWGVVLGSVLHMLAQVSAAVRAGWRYQARMQWAHKGVKKIIALMVPRTLALGVFQINYLVINAIASTLAAGSITVFNFAYNLQSVPINVIGVSIAIASFPVFSEAFAEKNYEKFKRSFSLHVRRILYFIVPLSLLFIILRTHMVRIVLGAGAFDWEDTILTAQSVGFFSLSLFAQSLTPLLSRSFYALQNTKTPVIISIVSIAVNIAGSLVLGKYMGVVGLALAFSIASVLNMALLAVWLAFAVGDIDQRRIFISAAQIAALSAAAALTAFAVLRAAAPFVDTRTFLGIFAQGTVAAAAGAAAYLGLSFYFGLEEMDILKRYAAKYWRFMKNKR